MKQGMLTKQIWPTIVFLLFFSILFGIIYPSTITFTVQNLLPHKSAGSLIYSKNVILGSEWIGQEFSNPKYFWGRLSSTNEFAYNSAYSSGSNLSAGNPLLIANLKKRVNSLTKIDPTNNAPIPIDLLTASASGLAPHISIQSAMYQAKRVATTRGVGEKVIVEIVNRAIEKRQFGILGEPRINVLKLNLKLDEVMNQLHGNTQT